jgi:hypothetical protein
LNGRTIFVAKPAGDMRSDYDRVVRELVQNGFTVVPDPAVDIPYLNSAVQFIDERLAQAEASIHLLGTKPGYVPEDQEPIVSLQLKRAGARLVKAKDGADKKPNGFRRFIWAPEPLKIVTGPGRVRDERNPLAVLKRFDRFHDSDEIVGGSLSKFVDLLIENLDRRGRSAARETSLEHEAATPINGAHPGTGQSVPHQGNGSALKPGSRVYLYHHREDRPFARNVAKTLTEKVVSGPPKLPAIEGEEAECNRLHRKYLAECDEVILCWALASDAWARAAAHELKNWRELGRDKGFDLRGLVLGPPPRDTKMDFVDFQQLDEIDVVVNQMKSESPSADELAKMFYPRAP